MPVIARPILAILVAVAATVAVLVGGVTPASATAESQRDPVGDTTVLASTGRAPTPVVNADIERIFTRHATSVVRVIVQLARSATPTSPSPSGTAPPTPSTSRASRVPKAVTS